MKQTFILVVPKVINNTEIGLNEKFVCLSMFDGNYHNYANANLG